MRHLIAQGANVNVYTINDSTVLGWAATVGNLAVMDVLIDAGANINAKTRHGTPLMNACRSFKFAAVRRLLDAGADPNDVDFPSLFFHPYTARTNIDRKCALATMLFAAGADVNKRLNDDGQTLLHHYCEFPRPVMVDFLLANGADHTIRDVHGRTPAYYAVRWSPDARDSLRAAGAKIPRYFIHGCTIM